ncbi:hypothetical protein AWENTII_005310 [Aspergillus wentii]
MAAESRVWPQTMLENDQHTATVTATFEINKTSLNDTANYRASVRLTLHGDEAARQDVPVIGKTV